MKNFMKGVLIISMVFLFSSYANSAELFSPAFPQGFGYGNQYLECSVVNAGAKPVSGTIEFCGAKGCDIEKTCPLGGFLGGGSLEPGMYSSCQAMLAGSGGAYCKITFNGNPRDLRALACVVEPESLSIVDCSPIE